MASLAKVTLMAAFQRRFKVDCLQVKYPYVLVLWPTLVSRSYAILQADNSKHFCQCLEVST